VQPQLLISQPVTFFAEGLRLDGDLHLPSDRGAGERLPAIVACSGFQGLKTIHPARFARALVPHGYAVLSFDYRGFGRSDGERGRLVPQDQVEDVRAAVSFLESRDEVDPERIGLLGWALGGGVVIAEAAGDDRVRAVAACNPIGDGERALRFMHDARTWERLLERIRQDRRRRTLAGRSALVHPFEAVRLDAVTRGYVDGELYKAAGFGSDVTLEAVEALMRFQPARDVHRIAPRPLLLVHGAANALHSPRESRTLYAAAAEPKRLLLLDGKGHTEWMRDGDPTFLRVRDVLLAFFGASVAPC
jgi:dipeptidyl aminopeptidase/acylaminoacyl peptidase